MKKRIIYIILILSIFSTNIVFGGCNTGCEIKNGPPKVLNDYISNLRKIITNLNTELVKNPPEKGLSKDINSIKTDIQKGFNKMIDWEGYYSYFDFFIIYGTKNEYVEPIWRDYNLLENESAGLEKYFKNIISRGYSDAEIDSVAICKGIDNCDFGGSVQDVLSEVISNHDNIKDFFRLSIIGKKGDFDKDLKLVGENFKTEFNKFYNENTTRNCSSCEGATFDRLQKEAEKISNWQKLGKDGIKAWQDAIRMINGSMDKAKYEQMERKVLEKELSRQGLSGNASQNVLNNLDKYNQKGGFSLDNNFITNSFDYIKDSISSQIQAFSDSIVQKFKSPNVKDVSVQQMNKTNSELKITKGVEERISEMYNVELPYAQLEDVSTDNFQSKIIGLHFNLTQAIKSFQDTKETAQKVCNAQDTGAGKCSTN